MPPSTHDGRCHPHSRPRGREVPPGRRARRRGAPGPGRGPAARWSCTRHWRTPGVGEVIVVSPDPESLAVAEAAGARPRRPAIPRPQPGAPGGPRGGRGGDRLLILPGDLPTVTPGRPRRHSRRRRRRRIPERRPGPRPPPARDQRPAAGSAGGHRPGVRRRQPGWPRMAGRVRGHPVRRADRDPGAGPGHARRPAPRRGACAGRPSHVD